MKFPSGLKYLLILAYTPPPKIPITNVETTVFNIDFKPTILLPLNQPCPPIMPNVVPKTVLVISPPSVIFEPESA